MSNFDFEKRGGGNTICRYFATLQNVLWAILFTLSGGLSAQVISPCSDMEFPFDALPPASACAVYGNESNTVYHHQIGAGSNTGVSTASQLLAFLNIPPDPFGSPTTVANLNFKVVGNFTVDVSLEFENAILKVSTNKKLSLTGDGRVLRLENDVLFACDGLWLGIELMDNNQVVDESGSLIEDAVRAITSVNRRGTLLRLVNSTFNRNVTGIFLVGQPTYSAAESPQISRMLGCAFTATSTLLGNATPLYGIRCQDVLQPLNALPISNNSNRFDAVHYGISATGNATNLVVHSSQFSRHAVRGISFLNGRRLEVRGSTFLNARTGIYMSGAEDLVSFDNTFTYTLATEVTRDHIRVENPRMGHLINVEECIFNISGDSQTATSAGLSISPSPTVPLMTNIYGNTFNLNTQCDFSSNSVFKPSTGLLISGECIPGSDMDISRNIFNVNAGHPYANVGFRMENGTQRNGLNFTTNDFLCDGRAIQLIGGQLGIDNEVTENYFHRTGIIGGVPTIVTGTGLGMEINNFEGLLICTNFMFYNSLNGSYQFSGQNMTTTFTANETHSSNYTPLNNLFNITGGSVIGQQIDNGNLWIPQDVGASWVRPFLVNGNSSLEAVMSSLFQVNEPQSVYNTTTNDYDLLSLSHPDRVFPDVPPLEDAFFDDGGGTPAIDCALQSPPEAPGDYGDIAIAEGDFGTWFTGAAVGWDAEQYLYRKLHLMPGYVSANSAFSSFLNTRYNSTVGQFYRTEQKMNEAIVPPAALQALMDEQSNALTQANSSISALDYGDTPSTEYYTLLSAQKSADDSLLVLEQQMATHRTQKWGEAQTLLAAVTTVNAWEQNKKRVYEIFLTTQLTQGGELPTAQIAELKTIGAQCPEAGGKIVFSARGMLSPCDYEDIREQAGDCAPATDWRSQDGGQNVPTSGTVKIELSPNPATDHIFFTSSASGRLLVFSTDGKQHLEANFTAGANRTNFHLAPGVYFFHLNMENGQREVRKVVVR